MELLPGKIHPWNLFYMKQENKNLRSPDTPSLPAVRHRTCHCVQSEEISTRPPPASHAFTQAGSCICNKSNKNPSYFLCRDHQFNTQSKEKNEFVSRQLLQAEPFCPYQRKCQQVSEESVAASQRQQIITNTSKMLWQSFG